MHIAQVNEPSNIPQREMKTEAGPLQKGGFQAAFETENSPRRHLAKLPPKTDGDTAEAPEPSLGAMAPVPPGPDTSDPVQADAPARQGAVAQTEGALTRQAEADAGATDRPAPPAAPAAAVGATAKAQTGSQPISPSASAGENAGWMQVRPAPSAIAHGDGIAPVAPGGGRSVPDTARNAEGGHAGAALAFDPSAAGLVAEPDFDQARAAGPEMTAGALRADAARGDAAPSFSPMPDIPRGIARQIAETLQRLPDGPVEVALRPEELGHVRITLATRDDAIHVTIHAERPETADLMRRHIEVLANEFRGLGYREVGFDFGQAAGNGRQSQPDPQTNTTSASPAEIIEVPVNMGADDRLDLRL